MRDSLKLFAVRGISIRLHITFPLILIWVVLQFGLFTGQGWDGALFGVIVTLLLFGIVVLHELGHSIAAQNYGIGVREIVLLPIGGVARLETIPENPKKELVIAAAGPAVNFALAVVLLLLDALFGLGGRFNSPDQMVAAMTTVSVPAIFNYIFVVNLFLALFNLIPAFPMDGGRVLRALLATRMDYVRATAIAVTIGQSLAWLMGLWGFLSGAFFLILIAVFIYIGAGQEGQMVQVRSVLRGLTVRHAYSRQTRALPPDATLEDAVQHILTGFQTDFPVCNGEQLVGLLTYKRIVEALNEHQPGKLVSAVMLTDVQPVAPDSDLFKAQRRMIEENVDVLPVVEGGRFLGLLTSHDVNEVYLLASAQPNLLLNLEKTGAMRSG